MKLIELLVIIFIALPPQFSLANSKCQNHLTDLVMDKYKVVSRANIIVNQIDYPHPYNYSKEIRGKLIKLDVSWEHAPDKFNEYIGFALEIPDSSTLSPAQGKLVLELIDGSQIEFTADYLSRHILHISFLEPVESND